MRKQKNTVIAKTIWGNLSQIALTLWTISQRGIRCSSAQVISFILTESGMSPIRAS